MFSKIVAGALGLGVVAVGGVMFHMHGSCPFSSGGCCHSQNTENVSVSGACYSDSSCVNMHCCSEEPSEVSTEPTLETLTIAPREVK